MQLFRRYEEKLKDNFKDNLILKLCNKKNVIHFGACDSPYTLEKFKKDELLHQKLMKVCNYIIGFDIDKKSIDLLKRYNIDNIYNYDITNSNFCKKVFNLISNKDYDYIIFGDIIEHLYCPGEALRNLRKLALYTNSKIIITTPNVFNYSNLAVYIHGNEKVHPDHFFWPSKKTMDKLLNTFGFKTIKFKYVHHGDCKILKNNIKGVIGELIFFRIFPHLRGTLFYIVKPKKLL